MQLKHIRVAVIWWIIGMSGLSWLNGCTPEGPNELDALGIANVSIADLSVRAWIADDNEERAKGLMFVTADEMKQLADGTERGMLFIFTRDQSHGFWMRNTIIDLDIAFIREDFSIVQTFTMAALDERSYTPQQPYRYALEVNAGVLAEHSIGEGDIVDIPESVLKGSE